MTSNSVTIDTLSDLSIDFESPQPESFCITDIAAGLSKTCRFSGQCLQFYSVAEHSIIVSRHVPKRLMMAALLHDASEAYMCDIVTPLKYMLKEYRKIEHSMMCAINSKFGVSITSEDLAEIKHVDRIVLYAEMKLLKPRSGLEAFLSPATMIPIPLSPRDAENLFLEEFNKYRKA